MELEPVGTEGVGHDQIGPGLVIAAVNGDQVLPALQIPALRGFAGFQAPGLKLGARPAVQQEQAAAQAVTQGHRWSLPYFPQASIRTCC